VRRSHAERSAETRARIIAAVVECIAELGFQRTTAAEIASRAGVTWGAVQHHFGGKHGILQAVLEDTFARFAARFEDISIAVTPIAERTSLFIERAWQHFGSRHYRSTLEILLAHATDPAEAGDADDPSWQQQMFRAWDGVFSRLFSDTPLPRRRRLLLAHYTLSVLSGLALTQMLQPESAARIPPEELDFLKQSLLAGLGHGR